MILVTGFEPFGGLTRNPSAEVAEAVGGDDVRAAVLPVDYDAVVPALDALLADPWDAVILMGVAIGRPQKVRSSASSRGRLRLGFTTSNRNGISRIRRRIAGSFLIGGRWLPVTIMVHVGAKVSLSRRMPLAVI